MSLIWDYYATGVLPPCFFPPDRVGNFKHDVPEGSNFHVITSDGTPVCGRFVSTEAPTYELRLDPGWVLRIS